MLLYEWTEPFLNQSTQTAPSPKSLSPLLINPTNDLILKSVQNDQTSASASCLTVNLDLQHQCWWCYTEAQQPRFRVTEVYPCGLSVRKQSKRFDKQTKSLCWCWRFALKSDLEWLEKILLWVSKVNAFETGTWWSAGLLTSVRSGDDASPPRNQTGLKSSLVAGRSRFSCLDFSF